MKLGPNLTTIKATIPINTALSQTIDTMGFPLAGIEMPAAWTAANLTFDGAVSGSAAIQPVYDELGVEVLVIAAASIFINIPPSKLAGVRYLRVRSGTAGVPVNQQAARDLILVLREV
jgi:hypothetical protein